MIGDVGQYQLEQISHGEGMSKNKYRLKRDVRVPWEMIESEAFKKLGGSALRTLIRFLQKHRWESGRRSRKLVFVKDPHPFTQAEAKHFGVGKTQHTNNINKLIQIGFMDLDHQGGAYGQDYSRYLLSERWRDYGTENFHEVVKQRACRGGNDIQSNLKKKNEHILGRNISGEETRPSVETAKDTPEPSLDKRSFTKVVATRSQK